MNYLKWLKSIVGMLTAASLLVACGGGASDTLPVIQAPIGGNAGDVSGIVVVSYNGTSLTTNEGASLTHFTYSDAGGQAQTTSVAVSGGLYTLNGNLGGAGAFGGIALVLDMPANSKNWTGATQLSIQLASAGTGQDLKVRIKRAGAADDGCLPSYTVTGLTANTQTFNIDLTATNFPLPSFCSSTANPQFAGAISDIVQIQVEDNTYTSISRPVTIRVGKIGISGLVQSAPPPPPPVNGALTCSSSLGSNPVASFSAGNTTTTSQGALIDASNYSEDNNGSFTGFESLNGCLSVRGNGGTGGFSGLGANVQLAPAGATVSWASGGTMSFPIASTNTANLKVVLSGGTSASLNGGCFPMAVIAGVSSNITTQSFSLNTATFQLPGYCTLAVGETQDSLLADALANLRQIQIEDNNVGAPVNMSFGTISRQAPAPATFTTLADISNVTFAQSPNDSFNDFPTITGDNSLATVFTATETRTKIILYTGAGGVSISSATTLRLLSVAASHATTAYVTLGKQPGGSCTITYIFAVTPTVANVDVSLGTLSGTAGASVGQTDCTLQTDVDAIKASVGDVQIRAFGAGTGPATVTLDAVQFSN